MLQLQPQWKSEFRYLSGVCILRALQCCKKNINKTATPVNQCDSNLMILT